MFNTLTLIAIVVGAAVALLLAYAASRPKTFRVARSASITAPPENIFPLINDLRRMNSWNPFLKMDPAVRLSYSGPGHGKGAANEWAGSGQAGRGRIEITDSAPFSTVTMKLDMIKPLVAHNIVEFTLQPVGPRTIVTWAMSGRSAYLARVLGVICNMDKMCGAAFDKGLAELAALAERSRHRPHPGHREFDAVAT
jgi:hypothetical protein